MELQTQFKKGFLEAVVLKLLSSGPTYGYQLNYEVNKKIKISESTLYPVLRRLETNSCLDTYQEEQNGRLRKYYQITTFGLKKLTEYMQMCNSINELIQFITEETK